MAAYPPYPGAYPPPPGAYPGSAPFQGSSMMMGLPPVGGFAPEVGGQVPAVRGPGIPGARFIGAVQDPETGTIIDKYSVPRRRAIPVQKRVPEVQEFMTYRVVHQPETRTVQVPVETMVPKEETVMVPRVKMVPVREMVPQTVTKMVPQTRIETRQFTVDRPVRVPERQQRTIMKVFEGQKIIQTNELLEFERPRLIPGRFRRRQEQEPEPVGVEWKHAYYQDGMQYNTQDPYYNPAYQTYDQNGPPQYPQYPPDQYADPAAGGRVDPQFSGPQRGQIH